MSFNTTAKPNKSYAYLICITVLASMLLTSCSDGNSPQPTSTNTTSPPVTTTIPPTSNPPTATVPTGTTATFNFDAGSSVVLTQSTPFEITNGGIKASFGSPLDPGAFSIQNKDTTAYILASFSGNYIIPNSITRTTLEIRFSQPIKSASFTYATTDAQGAANIENPSYLKVSAYMGSAAAGSITNRASFTGDTFPQDTVSFNTGQVFDYLVLEVVFQQNGGTTLLLDNLVVISS